MPSPLLLVLLLVLRAGRARICGSVDVRNDLVELEKLRGCTVVTGELFIVLLENVTAEEFEPYRFPELEQINGYLLMYKVAGLRTLGGLFPNLSVIRGQKLLMDYAFVIFNMDDLEEVGRCFGGTGFDGRKWNGSVFVVKSITKRRINGCCT